MEKDSLIWPYKKEMNRKLKDFVIFMIGKRKNSGFVYIIFMGDFTFLWTSNKRTIVMFLYL